MSVCLCMKAGFQHIHSVIEICFASKTGKSLNKKDELRSIKNASLNKNCGALSSRWLLSHLHGRRAAENCGVQERSPYSLLSWRGRVGLRHCCSIGDNSFAFVLVVVAPQTSACDLSQSLLSWNLSLQIYNKLFDQTSNSSIIYLYRFMDYRNFSLCSHAY